MRFKCINLTFRPEYFLKVFSRIKFLFHLERPLKHSQLLRADSCRSECEDVTEVSSVSSPSLSDTCRPWKEPFGVSAAVLYSWCCCCRSELHRRCTWWSEVCLRGKQKDRVTLSAPDLIKSVSTEELKVQLHLVAEVGFPDELNSLTSDHEGFFVLFCLCLCL